MIHGFRLRREVFAAIVLLLPGIALGQLTSEGPVRARSLPLAETIDREKDDAPYRLGPLRLSPFISLHDVAYNSNAWGTTENPIPDWSATIRGGSDFLLPLGGKSVLRGEVAPSYLYWDKEPAARGWGGVYGGEWIGLFNRMTVQVGGKYEDQIALVSSESEQTARNAMVTGRAEVEVDILRRLSVFAGWKGFRSLYSDVVSGGGSETSVADLNRAERDFQAGIRYKPDERLSVGILADWTTTRFVVQGQDSDNDARSARLAVRYDRPEFYVELTGGYSTAKGQTADSFFPIYRTGIYRWFVSYQAGSGFELQAYGWRYPVYSQFLDNPYYFETRNGIQGNWAVTPNVKVSGFVYGGPNTYPVEVFVYDQIVKRKDDVVTYGGGLALKVWRNVGVSGIYTRDQYTSNVPGVERSVYRITFNLGMGGKFFR